MHDQGFRIWYDEGIPPASEWPEAIATALTLSAAFLVFISPAAVQSDNVRREIHFAVIRKKPLFAVYLEETQLTAGLELQLGSTQGIMKWRNTSEHYTKKLVNSLPHITRGARDETQRDILQPAAGTVSINLTDGAEMVYVPAGASRMGDDDRPNNPPRIVTLDAFWIYKTPVTVARYRKFCQATGWTMPDPPEWGWKDDHPVVAVTWADAKAYCDWAGAVPPTEAQWEKAARGTDGRKYPWGNEWDRRRLHCSNKQTRDAGSTVPVGSFPNSASSYGCMDMTGNVWQWCADWYDADYPKSAPPRNPTGPVSGNLCVLRGGSWSDINEAHYRAAFRTRDDPTGRNDGYGFRAVRVARSDN